MFEFDYDKESDRMIKAKKDADVITSEYKRLLSECNIESLHALDIIYIYNKLMVISNMTPKGRVNFEEERKVKLKQGINILKRRIKEYYSFDIDSIDEVKEFIDSLKKAEELNPHSAYNLLQEYKDNLKDLYERTIGTVKIILPVHKLESINQAKHRENQYLNEIVDAVFAIGDYDGLLKYIARAHAGGMIVRDNQVYFPQNPFNIEESTQTEIKLVKPVSVYETDVKEFEPVIDFYLDEREQPILRFANEWISRKEKVSGKEFYVEYIPTSFLSNKDVTVQENGAIISLNEKLHTKYNK